ncbi:MAG: thiolase family protein [Proteobacteria bacterium]|nr:thiolase family protein [Pseudomonadota bacterium]
MPEQVAVVGTGQTVFRSLDRERTFVEQAQAAAIRALDDAGLTPDDIEAIVFSLAPTAFMGVTEAERWAVDHIWAGGKPMMRVHTGGATGGSAVHAGYSLVRSGMFRTVLVVGAERMGETPDAQYFLNQIWDPFYEKDLALQTIVAGAFLGQRHMNIHGTTEEDFARVVVRQRRNALKNPHAHLKGEITLEDVMRSPRISYPLKLYDCCPRSSGGAAMVLGDLDTARRCGGRPAFINGLGGVSNTVFLGDRVVPAAEMDLGGVEEHRIASRQAYQRAGITDPAREIQVAEVYDPFSTLLYPALESLGFCDPGRAAGLEKEGAWEPGGMVCVNPSGGTLCTNPIAVTGLVRNIEAARQVMGRAGDMQVPNVKQTLATALGGSGQFVNVTVYGQDHH